MIASFKDSDLEAFYYAGPGRRTRRMPAAIHKVLRRKLDQLFSAVDLRDLRVPPGNRLQALKGDREGYHSIRVSDQRFDKLTALSEVEGWRIVFRWERDAAYEVEFADYH